MTVLPRKLGRLCPRPAVAIGSARTFWLAHIENASTGVIIRSLKVVVKAYDSGDNEIPDVVRKATGELDISGGVQRIVSDALDAASTV